MPSEFPRSPRFLKGALVVFGAPIVPVPTNLIVFQFNPETMSRDFSGFPSSGSGDSDPRQGAADTQHAMSPLETFQMTVELDAADQLEGSHPLAMGVGLHPTLAALELLLYPGVETLITNRLLARAGSAFLSPAEVPTVLLVWGPARVVPVRVTSLAVNEKAYDQLLNPIQAEVTVALRAMTGNELAQAGPVFETLATVNHIAKEVHAKSNIFNAAEEITSLLPF